MREIKKNGGGSLDLRKTFIAGDTHGCFQEFQLLLKKAHYDPCRLRLILTGDVINRGPDSLKMLQWIKKRGAEAVRGNHEHAFVRGVQEGRPLSPVLQKLKRDMGKAAEEWAKWISSWPLYIEEEGFIAVHAGLVPGKHPKNSKPLSLMTIRTWDGKGEDLQNPRNPPWHTYYKGEKPVIYGHWAEQGLTVKENSIGLDSGCVYGGELSGILLPERRIVQVPALKNYCA